MLLDIDVFLNLLPIDITSSRLVVSGATASNSGPLLPIRLRGTAPDCDTIAEGPSVNYLKALHRMFIVIMFIVVLQFRNNSTINIYTTMSHNFYRVADIHRT